MLSLYFHKITIFGAKIQNTQVNIAFKNSKESLSFAEKFKITIFSIFMKIEISDTILEFLTVWKGKEGKNGVKYRKEAILVTYEMIDIVDAMTRFVAQPTQDIRVQNCKNWRKNWRKFWILLYLTGAYTEWFVTNAHSAETNT